MKNPNWTKDELILALELYFRDATAIGNKNHPEVIKLSQILNSLPIHSDGVQKTNFRNATGVSMKLSNYLRFDPSYKGKGLKRGGKMEEVVWNMYSSNIDALIKRKNEIIGEISFLKDRKIIHWPKDIKLISPSKFNTHFDAFKKYMLKESDIKFKSFSHPYIKEREDYKKDIRDKALDKLNFKDWSKADIGSGKILNSVINAIEIQGNNLLNWQGRYGKESKEHITIIKTLESKDKIADTENLFYNFYYSNKDDKIIFQNLIDYLGKKYALLAYLFYLKSDREYLPIASTYFDISFNKLGSNFKTSKKASWENYMQYITLIKDVKYFIEDKLSHEIQLIDAHSFLWIIGSKEEEDFIKESENNISVKFNKINTKSRKIKSKRKAGEVHTTTPVDFIENQKKKQLKGREAEEFVYNYEKEKLITEGKPDLALKVKDRSLELGLGYDILSFNKEGEEMHIEVKSSNSNSFYLSKNELEVSTKDKKYWIYIVTINQQRTKYIIKAIESPQFKNKSDFTLTPQEFRVTFSNCDNV